MERAYYTADEQRVLGLARHILDEVFHKGDVSRIDDLVADSGTLRHPVLGWRTIALVLVRWLASSTPRFPDST